MSMHYAKLEEVPEFLYILYILLVIKTIILIAGVQEIFLHQLLIVNVWDSANAIYSTSGQVQARYNFKSSYSHDGSDLSQRSERG